MSSSSVGVVPPTGPPLWAEETLTLTLGELQSPLHPKLKTLNNDFFLLLYFNA